MITPKRYELWNGKEVVGYYNSNFEICGRRLIVPEQSMLKQKYGSALKTIEVPIITRIISNDGVDVHFRIVLDVRCKSARQIKILNGHHQCP